MENFAIRFKGGREKKWSGLPLSGGNFDAGNPSVDKSWMLHLDVPLQIVLAYPLVAK